MKPTLSLLIPAVVLLFGLSFCGVKENDPDPAISQKEKTEADSLFKADSLEKIKLAAKAQEAFKFCTSHSYNTDFCLLLNFHVHSGLTRFYVWDFKLNQPVDSGLVSHGCGTNPWGYDYSKTNPQFSNVYESHCSSLGKYKIGDRGYSSWGIHVNYAMHGLDTTNNNSYGRLICMHSWDMVSENEIYPYGTPEGWGCAAVADGFMIRLDEKLKEVKRPVLLWIFV